MVSRGFITGPASDAVAAEVSHASQAFMTLTRGRPMSSNVNASTGRWPSDVMLKIPYLLIAQVFTHFMKVESFATQLERIEHSHHMPILCIHPMP